MSVGVSMCARMVLLATVVSVAACSSTPDEGVGTRSRSFSVADSISVRHSLLALSDTLAAAITRRDGTVAGRCAGPDSVVAYVTDGTVVHCGELSRRLSEFYVSLRGLDLHWEQREVRVLDENAGVITGWAAITVMDTAGATSRNRAIFTLVYARSAGQWQLVTAQKTTLSQ
jgi:calcium/calmodulin dependent protein kinase II association protein